MDLERLKQNLRLRSGRSKKPRKAQPLQLNANGRAVAPGDNADSALKPQSPPQQPDAGSRVRPAPRGWDTETALPQLPESSSNPQNENRPSVPRAATARDAISSPQKWSSRFGRSEKAPPRKNLNRENDSAVPAKPPALPKTTNKFNTDDDSTEDTSDVADFDLRPPPPRPKPPSVESLSEALFSSGHLNVLLRTPEYLARLTAFLGKYNARYHPVVLRYLETEKAITAVQYANAIAESMAPLSLDGENDDSDDSRPSTAATLNKAFQESNDSAHKTLLDSVLPMYVTYNLVRSVSECLINEITGRQTPSTRDLVGGLSEVFCLTDPNQPDNPIIYASEEFYRYTGYNRDNVIGHNCRFLQGTKTNRETVARMRDSIHKGEHVSEAILNYRRDGRPFINLLMIAPLHDDKGNVKYHIGAQVDVTKLVEAGKGLDGFQRYTVTQEIKKREAELQGNSGRQPESGDRKPRALEKLRHLSEMFDLEESAIVRSNSRSTSLPREDDERSVDSRRRYLGGSESPSEEGSNDGEAEGDATWDIGSSGRSGLSGKLPGVYDSYFLIRPAPSLRIVFVSPQLRRRLGNIVQHPFLSHVAASSSTLAGLKESFGTGTPVSAKINFMLTRGERRDGTKLDAGSKANTPDHFRTCWISATPLLGSDDNIGVWMIVVVEKTKVPTRRIGEGGENNSLVNEAKQALPAEPPERQDILPRRSSVQRQGSGSTPKLGNGTPLDDIPIKPRRLDDFSESLNSDDSTLKAAEDETSPPNLVHTRSRDIDETPRDEIIEHEKPQEHQQQEDLEASREEVKPSTKPIDSEIAEEPTTPSKQIQQEPEESLSIEKYSNSDLEPHALSASALEEALSKSLPGSRFGYHKQQVFDTPPRSPQEINIFHGFSDDEETPKRNNNHAFNNDNDNDHYDNEEEEGEEEKNSRFSSRPTTSGLDSPAGKSNGKHYMDYLRHPGSARTSSEYNRALSGSGILKARYNADEEAHEIDIEEAEDSDFECARSPYSVD